MTSSKTVVTEKTIDPYILGCTTGVNPYKEGTKEWAAFEMGRAATFSYGSSPPCDVAYD